MPRIADNIIDGVVFLYRTENEAKVRAKIGGTGFLVGKAIAGSERHKDGPYYVPYVISNRHVVWNAGASVITINRRDGSPPDIFPFEPTDWNVHPENDDLAAICVHNLFDKAKHKLSFIPAPLFITLERLAEYRVGLGDEIFMAGRFINHQGKQNNKAAARFGSLSMMPDYLFNTAIQKSQESFAVEMRSRTGFSGAPVAIYRTPWTVLTHDIPDDKLEFFALLGVNWGYVLDEDSGENTWLNGVVPAWKIHELLEVPTLKDKHESIEKKFLELQAKQQGGDPVLSAALPDHLATGENSTHREDFMRLVGAAARRPAQED